MAEVWAEPHLDMMIAAYEAECANPDMPPVRGRFEYYNELEKVGALFPFGAWICGYFMGFVGVLNPVLPHYSRVVAVTESLFVLTEFRDTGAGVRLMRLAEKKAAELNSPGILVSAPLVGDLDKILPRLGYKPWSVAWYKSFGPRLPAMGAEQIGKVADLEAASLGRPQIEIEIEQKLHGGMYCRTARIPAGVTITGVLIRVETILIVEGDVTVYIGDRAIDLNGYNVLAAEAGRKQAFYARSDVKMTMVFPTAAETVEEAEEEFTSEVERLQTRQLSLFSSGEQKCLASAPQPS